MSLNIDRSQRLYLISGFLTFCFFRIIAEGVPESQTRAFNKAAQMKGVGIIGPATVGGIKVRFFLQNGNRNVISAPQMLDLSF